MKDGMANPAYLNGIAAAATTFFLVSTSQSYSETDHERVIILEKRVAELEVLLKARLAGKGITRAKKQKANTSQQINAAPQSASAAQPAASSEAPASANAAAPEKSLADQPSEAPQELFILRENSVSLKPAAFEVSLGAAYASRRGQLQSDRGVIGIGSIRYGVFDWLEVSATVPFGYTSRTTAISPNKQVAKSLSGFGDSSVQGNFKLFEQTRDYPGAVLSLGAILPTGPSPYDFTNYALDAAGFAATPNPNNVFKDYFSRSAWGVHTNLQFYKTVDPIIVFFGVGADYLFSNRVQSYTVQEGIRYNYNMGFSFALSEKTTIGFTLNGSYDSALTVDGRKVPQSATEPVLATVSLIQRIAKNLFLEPSIAFGLNQDSPNFALGLGGRARF